MEINVKRIFFESDKNKTFTTVPHFELEDGTIRRPVGVNSGVFKTFIWCTDEEIEEQKRKNKEKD